MLVQIQILSYEIFRKIDKFSTLFENYIQHNSAAIW